MSELTQDRVRELFEYVPETGHLIVKVQRRGRCVKGAPAGCIARYVWIMVERKKYPAHHLVWLYHYGHIPFEIDHINQDKLDNRVENLRVCNRSQNTGNVGLRSTNTSGVRGVWFAKHCGKWRASIKMNGKAIHLGYFHDIDHASECYNNAAQAYFKEFAFLNGASNANPV